MAKQAWKAQVEIYDRDRLMGRWELYDFAVIAEGFMNAYGKVKSVIRKKYKNRRYKIIGLALISGIDWTSN